MKKGWALGVVCVLAGMLLGGIVGKVRYGGWTEQFVNWSAGEGMRRPTEATDMAVPEPKVRYERVFDFGTVSEDVRELKHAFRVENVGTAELKLSPGATSCRCTSAELPKGILAPGEAMEIPVVIQTVGVSGIFEQAATFFTNDPAAGEIQLNVSGRIDAPVWLERPELSAQRLVENVPSELSVNVYAVESQPLEVSDFRLGNEAIASFFKVTAEPLPAEALAEVQPPAGAGCRLKIEILPGIPMGAFSQTVTMRVHSQKRPELTLSIHGVVGDTIALFGRGWNEERNILTLGSIPSDRGLEQTYWVVVKGDAFDQTEIAVEDVVPECVRVSVGERSTMSETKTCRTALTISIPKGAATCNYWSDATKQLGTLTLKNKADGKSLKVYLRFAIY
ncbi:MAG: DUF1573 domain-containing protein [Planctomycetia bacterium]|nr:DUF1573 domain-containing protein [Planctomycetia bacterium]